MMTELEIYDALTDHPWYGEAHCYCGEEWCGLRQSAVTRLVNLTPHPVTVAGVTIPPTAPAARVEEIVDDIGVEISTPDGHVIPVADVYPQQVVNLPPPQDGVAYIVSRAVAMACPDRDDLYVPDGRARDASGQQTGGAARLVRVMPTLRATLAELQAIDAGLPHDPESEWPEDIAWRRHDLVLRLADLALRAGWTVGWDHDPTDPRRGKVQVVVLPDGRQVRKHMRSLVDGGGTVHLPWDGQTTRADVARAIAEYLAATAS
jgi:hypothetical protein